MLARVGRSFVLDVLGKACAFSSTATPPHAFNDTGYTPVFYKSPCLSPQKRCNPTFSSPQKTENMNSTNTTKTWQIKSVNPRLLKARIYLGYFQHGLRVARALVLFSDIPNRAVFKYLSAGEEYRAYGVPINVQPDVWSTCDKEKRRCH